MGYAFILIGLVLIVVGFRGEHDKFNRVLADDFTGSTNYVYWIVAVFILGAIGSYRPLKPVSDGFMILLVLVLFLSNNGFFRKLQEQIR